MKNQFTFFNLVKNQLSLRNLSSKKIINTDYPENFGEYIFYKSLLKNDAKTKVALYKNKAGKQIIAKIWFGDRKDYAYYSLLNEAQTYKTINTTLSRLKKNKRTYIKGISIPKFIKSIEKKNLLILLIEWVPGVSSEVLPEKKQFDAYFKVIEFLDYLGENMTENEKKTLTKRTWLYYIWFFPVLFLLSIIYNFDDVYTIVVGGITFISLAYRFITYRKLTLVHRDLHFGNILVYKSKITLIDLQFCVFSYRVYDFASTLRNLWVNEAKSRRLITEISKRYKQNKEVSLLLKPVLIFFAIHGLTARDFSNKVMKSFKNFLTFNITLPN